ncbi:MAG TPA: hypothetical protein VMX76_02140 [Nevskiaceae bacterium]|nr:hypothetical protein [Nevskiaceae bacterium]
METKEGLSPKGRQRRTLISLGVIGVLSAAARALVGKIPKVEAKREEFYRQAEAAKRAEEAAGKAKAAQAQQAKKSFVKPEAPEKPEVTIEEQREQFEKTLVDKLGDRGFEVKIGTTGSFSVSVSPGDVLFIRSLPDVTDKETKISTFVKDDKTPRSLGEVTIGDNKNGYCWEIFKLEDIISSERPIDVNNLDPGEIIDDPYWGRVVFACRLEYVDGEENRYLELIPPKQ